MNGAPGSLPWFLLVGAALLAFLASFATWRRAEPSTGRFALFSLAAGVWCAGAAAGHVAGSLEVQVAWSHLAITGAAFVPVTWCLFALRHVGVRMGLGFEAALAVPAVATVLLAWSNRQHGLVWRDVGLDPAARWTTLLWEPGPWTLQLHLPYTVGLATVALLVAVWRWWRAPSWTRWRFAAIGLGAVVVGSAGAWEIAGTPALPLGAEALATALVGVVLSQLLLRRFLFEPAPKAQRLIFDRLADPHLVLDRYGRVLDLNDAAKRLLRMSFDEARGATLAQLAPELRSDEVWDGTDRAFTRGGVTRLVRPERHPLGRAGEVLVSLEDVTDAAHEREALQRRGLLFEAADALVAMPLEPGAFEAALRTVLGRIGKAVDVSRVAVVRVASDAETVETRAAWGDEETVDGAPSQSLDPTTAREVREQRRTWIESDEREAARSQPGPTRAPSVVRVALPLTVHGAPWGALVVHGGRPSLLKELREALRSVAASLASSLERREAEATRRRAERFQRALLDLTHELLRFEVSPALYRLTLERAIDVIPGAERGSLLVRGHDGRYRFLAVAGFDDEALQEVVFSEGEVEALLNGRSVAVLHDIETSGQRELDAGRAQRIRDAREGDPIRATLVAEVAVGGERVATLNLDNTERYDAFGSEAVAMVESFAAQVGAVLQRLQLQARSDRAAEGQRLLAETERLLLAVDRFETFFPLLARLLLARSQASLRYVGIVRLEGELVASEFHGPTGRDAALDARVEASVADRDATWLSRLLAAEEGPVRLRGDEDGFPGISAGEAAWGFALRVAGEAWGAIVFVAGEDRRPDSAVLLGQVVHGLELALLRQRDRERQDLQLAQMRTLVATGEALRTLDSRSEVVERSLQAVLDMTRAAHCGLLLVAEDGRELHVAGNLRRGAPGNGPTSIGLGEGLSWAPLREDRTVVLHADDGLEDAVNDPGRRTHAYVGTPLRNREGVAVGVLTATFEAPGLRFHEDEVGFVEAVAQACGGALVRLALLEHSQNQAQEYRDLYAEAHRSEQRFRLLAENMSDTVCLHSKRGHVQYVSPSVEQLLGFPAEELVGRHPIELLHPDDVEAVRERLYEPLRQGEPVWGVSYRIRRRDGHYLWFETNAQAVLGERGAVVNLVSASRDVSERKRIERRLVHGALYDDLTGLPNRALLMDRLQHALDRARRRESRFAVLFLDLDRFKLVNDSLGHGAGDELLKAIGARLSRTVREMDTVARLSGDEFCVLLEDVAGEQEVIRTAERIQAAITEAFEIGDTDLFTSASIGIAFSDDAYVDPDELLRDADTAMYRAKAAGKARHAVFDSHMHRQAVHQLELETQLNRALERDELCVAYQPIVELADERVVGFEALVRWQHPQRGLLVPGDFVPIAEESGLIVQIDRWVLDRACRQAAAWRRNDPDARDLDVSVNLSAMHFALPDAGATLARIVEASGLEPSALKLEITESVLMARSDTVTEALQVLRERGVVVQIDDFGTGYSSLAYLQRLPIDSLKIDRSFLVGIEADASQRQLVATIVRLAQGLGIDIVAEGIEEESQLALLRTLGCRYGQGFLWSPPVPPDQIERSYFSGVRSG